MKNIHILPTNKPSRFHTDSREFFLTPNYQIGKEINSIVESRNIYITSDEEINDWYLDTLTNTVHKCLDIIEHKNVNLSTWLNKIILTTDQDLIKDGVQAIDDEFLEWFVKNPSCEEVEVVKTAPIRPFGSLYKIIIPKKELHLKSCCKSKEECYCKPKGAALTTEEVMKGRSSAYKFIDFEKQETLKEARANSYIDFAKYNEDISAYSFVAGWDKGAKWQQERSYTEEDMRKAFTHGIVFKEHTVSCCKEAIEAEFICLIEQFKNK